MEQVLVHEESTGLSFLPLASTGFGPKDAFGGESMDRLLKELATKFDLIIMDAPPVLAVSEARVLALKSDAVVFLLRWRKTPLNAARAALKLLGAAGGKVIGVGFTQVDMRQQVKQGYGDPGYYYEHYKNYYS
jgi:Mrp family chromosome partitioning ATPase